ncbi:MAG: EF-P lysine aminoacylase EpmA [Bdellovibrionales bacterium]
MDSKIRHSYLEQWTYPVSPPEALAIDEVSPKEGQFLAVAGRLAEVSVSKWELQGSRAVMGLQNLENFSLLPILRGGDLIFVQGAWNEGVIQVDRLELLAPNIAEKIPPFYEHEFSPEWALLWQEFRRNIRQFFSEQGFLEARTPTLVLSPGTEPFLVPFETHWREGKKTQKFYLPTSPELHLKKLLVRGFSKIFEMKDCFRNGETGPRHQPEFLMLEWYRSYHRLESIQLDVKNLIQFLLRTFADREAHFVMDQNVDVVTKTMAQLFKEKLKFTLTPKTTLEELKSLAREEKIHFTEQDTWNDVFFRLFLERVEGELGLDQPLIVTHYPPSQAAYARHTEDGWADRFELYWKGLEIANAFHELNDPTEQKRRFESDLAEQRRQGREPVRLDQEFLEGLKFGMPPSAGIALGVERLFMALFDVQDISHTRAFPFLPGSN